MNSPADDEAEVQALLAQLTPERRAFLARIREEERARLAHRLREQVRDYLAHYAG